jgi:hypothetical protein
MATDSGRAAWLRLMLRLLSVLRRALYFDADRRYRCRTKFSTHTVLRISRREDCYISADITPQGSNAALLLRLRKSDGIGAAVSLPLVGAGFGGCQRDRALTS